MSPWCPSEAMHTVARAHVARRKRTESGTKVQGWNPTLLSNSVLQLRRKRRTIGATPTAWSLCSLSSPRENPGATNSACRDAGHRLD